MGEVSLLFFIQSDRSIFFSIQSERSVYFFSFIQSDRSTFFSIQSERSVYFFSSNQTDQPFFLIQSNRPAYIYVFTVPYIILLNCWGAQWLSTRLKIKRFPLRFCVLEQGTLSSLLSTGTRKPSRKLSHNDHS